MSKEYQLTEQFRVGVIAGTHGLKGEVKIFPTTDDPERFLTLKEVILDLGSSKRVLTIRKPVKFFKQFVILGFEGLDRIEDVERFRGKDLLIDRKDTIPLEEGEYFIPDLIGLEVVEEDGTPVGVLSDVLETGANKVYVTKTADDKELLLPAIPDCIKEISLDEGIMKVYIMPGLRDL